MKLSEDSDPIKELKHSVKMHLLIMSGPSQQLSAFLLKLIDFLTDDDENRVVTEMNQLSLSIVEALALHVHTHIDKHQLGDKIPQPMRTRADEIIVTIGKVRSLEDKISSKYVILRAVATVLKQFGEFTHSNYPKMTDLQGNVL